MFEQLSPEQAYRDLYIAIRDQKMLERIKFTHEAIAFLENHSYVSEWSFNTMINTLERYIRRMNPDQGYKKCNKCGNTLVITGHYSMHYSKTLFYFCLNCAASYMTYRTSEHFPDFGMLYPDFTEARE